MRFSTLLNHCTELCRIVFKSFQPSDTIAAQYFRSKKYIGSNERKIISEIAFSHLRISSLSEFFLTNYNLKEFSIDVNSSLLYISAFISYSFTCPKPLISIEKPLNNLYKDISSEEIFKESLSDFFSEHLSFDEFLSKTKHFFSYLNDYFLSDDINESSLLVLNDFFIDSLKQTYTNFEVKNIAKSALFPAEIGLRINTLSSNNEEVREILTNEKISFSIPNIVPNGFLLNERVNLNNLDLYKTGKIEVQDIGSQLISIALNPSQGSFILDACAGAGGKTLHLADITKDKANIIATDIEYNRLKEISKRAAKAGYSSIEVVFQKKMELRNMLKMKFDFILIDAPCSGSGTLRRMPMVKYRINQKLISKLAANQYKILEYYSHFLKEDGELVYATCSVLPQENQEVIERFLQNNSDFAPAPIKPAFDEHNINIASIDEDSYSLSLNPAVHNTDGFFMAKIKRNTI